MCVRERERRYQRKELHKKNGRRKEKQKGGSNGTLSLETGSSCDRCWFPGAGEQGCIGR